MIKITTKEELRDLILEEITTEKLNKENDYPSKVTDMYCMFYGCESLKSVPQLDTSNVTNTNSMVDGCESLKSVPHFDTSYVTNIWSMFNRCKSLEEINFYNSLIDYDSISSDKFKENNLELFIWSNLIMLTQEHFSIQFVYKE